MNPIELAEKILAITDGIDTSTVETAFYIAQTMTTYRRDSTTRSGARQQSQIESTPPAGV